MKADNKLPRFVIGPGEFHVSKQPAIISTLLGSCVAACLYDPVQRIIGMNHFLLAYRHPFLSNTLLESDAGRYGLYAMELLINDMLQQGANKLNLQAKVFGGGNVLRLRDEGLIGQTVGETNIRFVKEFLRNEGIPIVSASTGGDIGRKVHFFGSDFSVYVKPIFHADNRAIERVERFFWLKTLKQLDNAKENVEYW